MISSNLSFNDIISYCKVNRETAGYCRQDIFWQTLIRHRFPEQSNDSLYNTNPKLLFYYLTRKPGTFVAFGQEILYIGDDFGLPLLAFQVGYLIGKQVNPNLRYYRISHDGAVSTELNSSVVEAFNYDLTHRNFGPGEIIPIFDVDGQRFPLSTTMFLQIDPKYYFSYTIEVLALVSKDEPLLYLAIIGSKGDTANIYRQVDANQSVFIGFTSLQSFL